MATTYITDALRLLESFLGASGRFSGGVTIGLPAAAPETPAAAIFLARGIASLISTTSFHRQRDVVIRIYMDAAAEPRDKAEIALDQIVYDTEQDISTNLNLSSTGWVVLGDIIEDYDYAEVGSRSFRIVDITLTLSYVE